MRKTLTIGLAGAISWLVTPEVSQAEPLTGTGCVELNYARSLLGYNNNRMFGTGFSIGNGAKAEYLANLLIFGAGFHF